MPNWCSNILTITADDDKEVGADIYQALVPDEALAAEDIFTYRNEGWGQLVFTFSKVYPVPEKLANGNGWYDWCVSNWGTKWDAACTYVNRKEPQVLEFSYDTAWSPAEGFVKFISRAYPELTFRNDFMETGCSFVGHVTYKNGVCIDDDERDEITRADIERFGWDADEWFANEEE